MISLRFRFDSRDMNLGLKIVNIESTKCRNAIQKTRESEDSATHEQSETTSPNRGISVNQQIITKAISLIINRKLS